MTQDDVIKASVSHVNEAGKRSRLAFLACTTASLMVFAVIYNTYFSWYGTVFSWYSTTGSKATPVCDVAKDLVAQWLKTQWITVGLLGIQVGVADLSIVGAMALVITATWLFFAVRREHHSAIGLLNETIGAEAEAKRFVFFGIISGLVFVTTSEDDAPRRLGEFPKQAAPFWPARVALRLLIFLPFICTLLMAGIDTYSLFQPATFRCSTDALWTALQPSERAKALMMILTSTLASYFLLAIGIRVAQFGHQITDALRSYAIGAECIPDPLPGPRSRWTKS